MIRPTYLKELDRSAGKYQGCPRFVIDIDKMHWSGELSAGILTIAMENGLHAFYAEGNCKGALDLLGRCLSDWKGDRPFVSISLKAGLEINPSIESNGENISQSIADSFIHPGIGNVDLLILEEPVSNPYTKTIHQILKSYRDKNLSGLTALSGFSAVQYQDILNKEHFDLFMGYNRLDACNLDALENDIPFLKTKKMGYLSSSPLHFLLLGSKLGQYSRERPSISGLSERDITIAVMASRIAKKNSITLEELAYRYLLSIAESDSVIAEPASVQELGKVIEYWNRGTVSEELFNEITDNILKFKK